MFASFFYLLRARGLAVSLNEWLTLVEALEQGLHSSSFTGFYYLCRAVLVKSEADFDKFDGAFLEFFKDISFGEELPPELLSWLENPSDPKKDTFDEARAEENRWLDDEEIRRMFRERLQEQDAQHNYGSYWIGTSGVSVFGNSGMSPKGIRVGSDGGRRFALEVAGERRFRDFRQDAVLDNRRLQVALRSLRQFSNRIDAPKTELDIDGSIRETGDNAGHLKLVFGRPRKNTVKLLLLMDSGGSMDYYSGLCASLFQAVSKSNHFKDLRLYYFHNIIGAQLYTTPEIRPCDSVSTRWVLQNLDSDYKVIVVGDALMSSGELLDGRYSFVTGERMPSGLEWLRMFKERYPRLVWLNPTEQQSWFSAYWGNSYEMIQQEVDMYTLTVENLEVAIKKLMVAR